MASSNRFKELAVRFWPSRHKTYEEMCALEAAGQLGGPQIHELNAHVSGCRSCRQFLSSMAEVSIQAGPLLAEQAGAADVAVPDGMRDRFLARLADEERTIAQVVDLRGKPVLAGARGSYLEREQSQPAKQPSRPTAWRTAAAVAAYGVAGFIGFAIGNREMSRIPREPAGVTDALSPLPPNRVEAASSRPMAAEPDTTGRLQLLEHDKAVLTEQLVQARDHLSAERAAQAGLAKSLAEVQNNLMALMMEPAKASQTSPPEAQETRALIAGLQTQIDQLRQQLAEAGQKLASQRWVAEDLSARLDATTNELQRERDTKAAKSQLGEVLAARNLHIVDVYDADGNGRRKNAVGRVFYIEGKSLVFYAYDLDRPGRFKSDVAFHVWGGKVGAQEVVHNLGLLRKDEDGQSRWKLTFDDPQVLARINSVYVTVETANKRHSTPDGRKILFAYLGGPPNHAGDGLE